MNYRLTETMSRKYNENDSNLINGDLLYLYSHFAFLLNIVNIY